MGGVTKVRKYGKVTVYLGYNYVRNEHLPFALKRFKIQAIQDLAVKQIYCISDEAYLALGENNPSLTPLHILKEAKEALDKLLDEELPIHSTDQYSYIRVTIFLKQQQHVFVFKIFFYLLFFF